MIKIAQIYYFFGMAAGVFLNCRLDGTPRIYEKAGGER